MLRMPCSNVLDGILQHCTALHSASCLLPPSLSSFLPSPLFPSSLSSIHPSPLPHCSHPPLPSIPATPASPPPQATKLLKKSVKTNPSHAASWVALARIHQRTGQVLYCTILLVYARTHVHRAFMHRHLYVRVQIRTYIPTCASHSFCGRVNGACVIV